MSGVVRTIIKAEQVVSTDVLVMRPIIGKTIIHNQGYGLKTSTITIANAGRAFGKCKTFGVGGSGTAEANTTVSSYSGTPYSITTIRCVGGK